MYWYLDRRSYLDCLGQVKRALGCMGGTALRGDGVARFFLSYYGM